MVGLRSLDPYIGVRLPASQKSYGPDFLSGLFHFYQSREIHPPLFSSR
jgi:hypothetical protein